MATAATRRAPVRTGIKSAKTKVPPMSADQLADAIASNLTISNGKGKQKASNTHVEATDEEIRFSAMKSVNSASLALSTIVQSGWKKSSDGNSSSSSRATLASATASADAAAKHLAVLRWTSPRDMDMERAAMSVLGKLVALDMYEAALSALADMHPRLCALLQVSPPQPATSPAKSAPSSSLHLASIPIPSSVPMDPMLLTLTSTYLAYTLSVLTHPSLIPSINVDELSSMLNLTSPTILLWLPTIDSLPTKHLDSVLTRAYTALTKFCSSASLPPTPAKPPPRTKAKTTTKPTSAKSDPQLNPQAIFQTRMYALSCLVHTSPSTIEPNTFWEQAIRFAVALVKSVSSSTSGSDGGRDLEDQAAQLVLRAYADVVGRAEKRPDAAAFMDVGAGGDGKGKGFVAFCDHWMAFAKRAGDICTLEKIAGLMSQGLGSSSSSSSADSSRDTSPLTLSVPATPVVSEKSFKAGEDKKLVLKGTKICAAFAQITVLLEQCDGKGKAKEDVQDDGGDLVKRAQECTTLLKSSASLHTLLLPPAESDDAVDDIARISGKVDRAFEKMRRAAVKLLDSSISSSTFAPAGADKSLEAIRTLLEACVDALQRILPSANTTTSTSTVLTRALDALFVLARTKLSVADPRTYVTSYDHIARAKGFLDSVTSPSNGSEESTPTLPPHLIGADVANYTRCVSGAFHNLGGALYQGTRYGAAVPFLREASALGGKALNLREEMKKGDDWETYKEKDLEGWKQLEDQLYRRWELLGVCYSKNGDRKNTYSAFKQCIHTFPYASSGFSSQTDSMCVGDLFSSNQQIKQLATTVDRVSYMGASELLLPGEEISLRFSVSQVSTASEALLDRGVVGALLERQLESLEPSWWKEGVRIVCTKLLQDMLEVYREDMPVRRARVLVRCMELAYRNGSQASVGIGEDNVQAIGEEAERLLTSEDVGKDTQMAHYRSQYRASVHLWLALHAHRREDPEQSSIVGGHADQAWQILKELLVMEGNPKVGRKTGSPKVARGSLQAAKRLSSPKAKISRAPKMPAAPRKPIVRKRNPVTPKPPTRAAFQPVSLNTTPPQPAAEYSTSKGNPRLLFDDFDKLSWLFQLSARILGLLSLTLPRARILDVSRRLCERHAGTTSDGHIITSIDLAHEYVNLGKMKRAGAIFNQTLQSVRSGKASDEACALFFLNYAESLAVMEEIPRSSSAYCEALALSERLEEETGMSTIQRVHSRVKRIEKSAIAARVFSIIQYHREDIPTAIESMLQSLRLWNRALETLARLNPSAQSNKDSDPFHMSSLQDVLPGADSSGSSKDLPTPKKIYSRRPSMDGLEWRISEGLLSTLFALCEVYHTRGSVREAEYFAQQAQDLAETLNAPAMVGRAWTKKGEIQLHQGQLEAGYASLMKATEFLCDIPGIDMADIHRLQAEYNERTSQYQNAQQLYSETLKMLEDLNGLFMTFDSLAFGPRKSIGASPNNISAKEIVVPELLAAVLTQHIWLLHEEGDQELTTMLDRLSLLPQSCRTKAEENALMAKLRLHDVYERFHADMFLSSLTESTIALPVGMTSKQGLVISPGIQDILVTLEEAERFYRANLALVFNRGSVSDVREASVSLALIRAFQTSLGKPGKGGPALTARLLDSASAITLRREMLDVIKSKFQLFYDDLQWLPLGSDGTPLPRPVQRVTKKFSLESSPNSGDEDDDGPLLREEASLKDYWVYIRIKYESQLFDPQTLSASATADLPSNWTVIHINVTEDKNALFITRQEGGDEQRGPLIFRVPLSGRRDNGSGEDDEDHLTFADAITELRTIVKLSDEGTKAAAHVKADDEDARVNWWKQRAELDTRMRELLGNIEFCWLGAFKTILGPRPNLTPEEISELRTQFDIVFQRVLHLKDKKTKQRPGMHKKNGSQSQPLSQVTLDDALIECFSTLSPKCRDEELEDLVYFILDLYQFHGVPVAIAEVDIIQVVVDLRIILEEHAMKTCNPRKLANGRAGATPMEKDEHVFLVLDKNVQGLPWESIPILRGRSVSRIPSLDFLHDRLQFANMKRQLQARDEHGGCGNKAGAAVVDPRKGFFVLNPSGDLGKTEGRFKDWAKGMQGVGWDGVIGKPISEQQFLNALRTQDLVVYFGHGGGEQYVRSHKIRSLRSCAATMLWGCSSGALREMGDYDRVGTPYNYMLAGCPTLVANLWDVTDRDIDKFSQSVFDKMNLTPKSVFKWSQNSEQQDLSSTNSVVSAVARSRDSCKLKYLTGAAPVVYGIPFYL